MDIEVHYNQREIISGIAGNPGVKSAPKVERFNMKDGEIPIKGRVRKIQVKGNKLIIKAKKTLKSKRG
jgi:hypothetical protein